MSTAQPHVAVRTVSSTNQTLRLNPSLQNLATTHHQQNPLTVNSNQSQLRLNPDLQTDRQTLAHNQLTKTVSSSSLRLNPNLQAGQGQLHAQNTQASPDSSHQSPLRLNPSLQQGSNLSIQANIGNSQPTQGLRLQAGSHINPLNLQSSVSLLNQNMQGLMGQPSQDLPQRVSQIPSSTGGSLQMAETTTLQGSPSGFQGPSSVVGVVGVNQGLRPHLGYPRHQTPVGIQPGQSIVVASGMSGPPAATASAAASPQPPLNSPRGRGGVVRIRGRGGPRTRGPRPDFRLRMRPSAPGARPGGPPGRFRPPRPGMRPRMPGQVRPGQLRPGVRPGIRAVGQPGARPGGPTGMRPGGPPRPPAPRAAAPPAPPPRQKEIINIKIEDDDDDIIEIEAPPPVPKNATIDKLKACGISVSRQAPPKMPRGLKLPPG